MSYVFILLGWFAFGLIHSLTASTWLKRRAAARLGRLNRYYRLLYNGIAIVTFVPVLWLHRVAPTDYVFSWQGNTLAGTLLTALGLITGIIALRGYDLAEFIGWSAADQSSGDQVLRQEGLLRYVRHPLYTGTILSLAGIWIAQPTWSYLLLFLLGSLYIRIGIHFEEQKLVASFGNAYIQYRQRVPMLIPRLSPP